MQLYEDTQKPLNEFEMRFWSTQYSLTLVMLRGDTTCTCIYLKGRKCGPQLSLSPGLLPSVHDYGHLWVMAEGREQDRKKNTSGKTNWKGCCVPMCSYSLPLDTIFLFWCSELKCSKCCSLCLLKVLWRKPWRNGISMDSTRTVCSSIIEYPILHTDLIPWELHASHPWNRNLN